MWRFTSNHKSYCTWLARLLFLSRSEEFNTCKIQCLKFVSFREGSIVHRWHVWMATGSCHVVYSFTRKLKKVFCPYLLTIPFSSTHRRCCLWYISRRSKHSAFLHFACRSHDLLAPLNWIQQLYSVEWLALKLLCNYYVLFKRAGCFIRTYKRV